MTILKREVRTHHFTIIFNEPLQNEKLSWAARGLLAYLLSLPDNWEMHIEHLVKQGDAGRDKMYALVKELKNAGHVEHLRYRDEKGKVTRCEYLVREIPVKIAQQPPDQLLPENPEEVKIPHPDLPDEADPDEVNPYVLKNTNSEKIKNNNKTAAIAVQNFSNMAAPETKSAAVFLNSFAIKNQSAVAHKNGNSAPKIIFTDNDLIIGKALTPTQEKHTKNRLLEVVNQSGKELDQLLAEVIHTLLCPASFTKSGNDFLKKINSIVSVIRAEGWTTPTQLRKEAEDKIERLISENNVQRSVLHSEIGYLQDLVSFHQNSGNLAMVDELLRQLNEAKTKLDVLGKKATAELVVLKKPSGYEQTVLASNC